MHVFTKAVASHAQQLSGDKYNVDQAFRSMLTRCHVLCQLLDTSCLDLLVDCVAWMMQMYSKALVVLPYVSVVAEKTEHLTTILAAMRCKVKGYYGSGEGGTPLAPG